MKNLLHFFWFNHHKRQGDEGIYQTSNQEIQKWAELLLTKHFVVHSTSCVSQGRVTMSEKDVLLGHLSWDPHADRPDQYGKSLRNWMLDNRLSPEAPSHPNSFVLTPWVPIFPLEWTDSMPFYESQLDAAKLIFAICGPIWYEQTLGLQDDSVQCRVKSKLVRLNMGINPDALMAGKSAFNPVGKRKVIHVSNLGSYKGFDLLLESTKGVTVPSIGSNAMAKFPRGEVEFNAFGKQYLINNVGPVDNRSRAQIQQLIMEHDFYVHTSTMDAQASTILEFAGRGLIPIVTPESGFASEEAIYLTRYASRNKEIIHDALELSEDELIYRRDRIIDGIRREHSWERFFDTIAEKIALTCQA